MVSRMFCYACMLYMCMMKNYVEIFPTTTFELSAEPQFSTALTNECMQVKLCKTIATTIVTSLLNVEIVLRCHADATLEKLC
jgi:hypothetical protein